jgi:predicted nucleic acid-binding protein
MNVRAFCDTNVLVYATDAEGRRGEIARRLLSTVDAVVSVQVLNEFVAVARRKLRKNWDEVNQALVLFKLLCQEPVPITMETHEEALKIAARQQYHIYDALVIAAARQASCDVLYSEDMQHSQRFGDLTIRNPFVA